MKFLKVFLVGVVALGGLYLIGQYNGDKTESYSSKIDQISKLDQISNGLAQAIRIEGRETEFFTLKERMAHYNVPGISIAYMENHKVVWTLTEGVTDKVSMRPVDENTVFQAASISKPTFATVLMKYRENSPLDLDAPVNSLLKSWQLPSHEWSEAKPVTLRRLLSHSAGTTVHGFGGYAAGDAVPDIIGVLEGTEPSNSPAVFVDLEPSTQFRYSGGGTTLAQLVLQDQSDIALPELAKTLIFDPLGMTHSGFIQPLSGPLAQNAAVPYDGKGEAIEGGAHTYRTMAAAGLWTTPSDLMRLSAAMQLSLNGETGSIMSQSSAKEMMTIQQAPVGIGYFLEGEDVTTFSHGGSNAGFRAHFIAHIEGGDGMAIMTNSDSGSALINEIMIRIGEVYGWAENKPTIKKLVPMTAEMRTSYTGTYDAPAPVDAKIIVTSSDEGLMVNVGEFVVDQAFLPEGESIFFAMDGTPLTFEFDEEGTVIKLIYAGNFSALKSNE